MMAADAGRELMRGLVSDRYTAAMVVILTASALLAAQGGEERRTAVDGVYTVD
jgi:hypothetical protein